MDKVCAGKIFAGAGLVHSNSAQLLKFDQVFPPSVETCFLPDVILNEKPPKLFFTK